MEVEDEFLENATTMVKYAKSEITQFLDWTNKQTAYGQEAEAIIKKLDDIINDIKQLKKTYNNR